MSIKLLFFSILLGLNFTSFGQSVMTAKQLIELNRISAIGISDNGEDVIYSSSKVNVTSNSKKTTLYRLNLKSGESSEIKPFVSYIKSDDYSTDGKYKLLSKEYKIEKIKGTDFYPELTESNVMIYNDLNYRHWDKWEDGTYSHVVIKNLKSGDLIDLMSGEPYDCPQQPFGGSEDYTWNPDGTKVLYVTKKKSGKEYAVSTNTDIYEYDLATKKQRT